MAKEKKKRTETNSKSNQKESFFNKFSISSFIPPKYQTLALLGVILLVFLIYFSPMYFSGQTFRSPDIITSKSISSFVENEREDFTLWYPYIFGGMPAYGLATDSKWFNLLWMGISTVRSVFTAPFAADYSRWTFYLLLLAINTFFLVNYLTKNKLIGLFASLATSFSTGLILFLFIGHVTKLTALAFYPLIFLMILHFRDKIKLLDFALLVMAIHLSFQGWHVQIIYYSALAVGLYFIYNISRSFIIKNKIEGKQYIKSALVYSGAFIIAILIQSDNLTQVYEYNEYSTRGTESIVDLQQGKTGSQSDSDFYNYATNWSFSPGEVLTFIVPSFYGFGNVEYVGPLTQNRPTEINTYFGQMPFVDVAMYMGAVVFFFALFGAYANRKNSFVQFLIILSVLALLISFGRTFPLFYDLMFYYFPFFDKFRVPSMVLIMVQLSMPVLAAFGLKSIIEMKNNGDVQLRKILQYSAYAFTAIFIISIIGSGTIADWFKGHISENVAMYKSQQARQFNALADFIAKMFVNDLLVVFGLLTTTFWIALGYVRGKVSADFMMIILIAAVLFDLIRIDNRAAKYQDEDNVDNLFNKPDYVQIIEKQNDTQPFRIFNMKQDGSMGAFNQNQNFNAYFGLQDFYGYSSIKPRTYQDFMDVVGPVNHKLWNMLNVKYIIMDKPNMLPGLIQVGKGDKSYVYENATVLPRAFFVDSTAQMDNFQFLQMVKQSVFNPNQVAYTHGYDLEVDKPDSTTYVTVKDYKDEKIVLEATASGNNLLFLGDTYYPKGWTATIDGNETDIYRVNHGYRAIIVPEGKHEIIFNYLPTSWVISKYLALIFSTLVVGMILFGLYQKFGSKKEEI
ncbi:MAG: membrane protein [Melioribacteraceae bacterium]|nr:MAG: membrane protein [Melioribacteraceae bacterium]